MRRDQLRIWSGLKLRGLASAMVVLVCGAVIVGSAAADVSRVHSSNDAEVVKAFLQHVNNQSEIDAQRREQIVRSVEQIAQYPEQSADAITEGLVMMYPEYRQAVEAAAGDDPARGRALLAPLADSSDPYLAADAGFYLARLLIFGERFEEALPLLERMLEDSAGFSARGSIPLYFMGVAYAGLLDNQRAIESFEQFLADADRAPERLRVAAWRQKEQLRIVQEGQLTDVHQRMDYSRRRLSLDQPDDPTQEQQRKIVDMLAVLIREQEKRECSSCSGDGEGQQQERPESQPGEQEGEGDGEGRSDRGGGSQHPGGVARRVYDDGPASPWSRLRDRSRDPANAAIKDNLPPRYRDIVERYFDRAAGHADDRR